MRAMTKSAVRLAREAHALGQASLAPYASRCSKHDFTQPQRFAALRDAGADAGAAAVPPHRLPGLRRPPRRVGRGAPRAPASEGPEGAALLHPLLRRAPAPRRGRKRGAFRRAQTAALARARAAGLVGGALVAAVDATGLDARRVSLYFLRVQRYRHSGERVADPRGQWTRTWPRFTAVVETHSHLVLGAVVRAGPAQDSPDFAPAMRQAAALLAPQPFAAALGDAGYDAGYDAEPNHRLCREELGIPRTAIKINRRRTGARWPPTPYRREMRRAFPRALYHQRAQAERVCSRLKRRLGAALTARHAASQRREIVLRVLTYNLMLLHARRARISTEHLPA